jgi:hypothetical protein
VGSPQKGSPKQLLRRYIKDKDIQTITDYIAQPSELERADQLLVRLDHKFTKLL